MCPLSLTNLQEIKLKPVIDLYADGILPDGAESEQDVRFTFNEVEGQVLVTINDQEVAISRDVIADLFFIHQGLSGYDA